jgi:sucrose-6-phosphate hydrolase SacC (GH32 family)
VDGVPWSGAHALPWVLTREGTRLRQDPIEAVESLRGRHERRAAIRIASGARGLLTGLSGDTLELVAEFEPGTSKRFGLIVRDRTRIYVDAVSGRFGVSVNVEFGANYPELGEGPAYLRPGQPVCVHVFLDRALLEVFVNGQSGTAGLTADPSATGLDLFSEGGEAILRNLDVWEMRPVWRSDPPKP